MIYVSRSLPVNEPGEQHVSREELWQGLVAKAGNALPFVAAMTRCEIVARYDENTFDRDISFRGQDFTERITLEPMHRVVFTRLAGSVLGTIANEIEGGDDNGGADLSLRFSFALVLRGVEGGSAAERTYADGMTDDYLKAVDGGDSAVFEVVSHYTTKGGAHVAMPCVSLLDRAADGRVRSLRVHIDLAPLFAQMAAEATAEQVVR